MNEPSAPSAPAPGLGPWLRRHFSLQGEQVLQLVSYVIVLILMINYILDPPAGHEGLRFNATVLALSGILVVNFLWDDIARSFPTPLQGEIFNILLTTGMTLLAVWAGEMLNGLYLVFMLSAQANVILRRFWVAQAYTALVTAAFLGILRLQGASDLTLLSVFSGMLLGLVFIVTVSQILVRYSEQTERAERLATELQKANGELLAARQREQDLAVAEERLRLAREIHDGLGHHLTVLSIQLQAAEKLLASQPDLAGESIRLSRDEAAAALKEVRQSVAALRQGPVHGRDLPAALSGLVSEFDRRAALHAELSVSGAAVDLPAAVAQTLYRAAQEGLTNAQKHAQGATRAAVRLEYGPGQVRLSVEDDGAGGPPCEEINAEPGSGGFGLAGLRERVSQLQGTLECGSLSTGGFRVAVSLPLEEGAAA